MQQPNIHVHRNIDRTVDFDFYRRRAVCQRQLARRLVFQRGLARFAAYMRTIIRTISGRNQVIIIASPGRYCGGRMVVEGTMHGSFTEMSRHGDQFDRLNDGPIDYRKILRAERAASRARAASPFRRPTAAPPRPGDEAGNRRADRDAFA